MNISHNYNFNILIKKLSFMYQEKIKGILEKILNGNTLYTKEDQFDEKLSLSQSRLTPREHFNQMNNRKFDDNKVESIKNNSETLKNKLSSTNIDLQFGIFPSNLIKDISDTENWKVKFYCKNI